MKIKCVVTILSCTVVGKFVFAEEAVKPVVIPAVKTETAEKKEEPKRNNPDIPGVDKVLADITAADAALHEPALKALLNGLDEEIKASPKPYLKKIVTDLAAEAAVTREAAVKDTVQAITDIKKGNPKGLMEVQMKLNSPDPVQRDASRVQLTQFINGWFESKAIDKLINDLASTDAAVVTAATQKLKDMGEDAASDLVTALEDERVPVKKTAAEILKTMGPAAKDVATDLAFLLDNDDKGVRRLAAQVLEAMGPNAVDAVDDLVQYLDNDERAVRRSAANILKKIGPAAKEATGDLVDLLTNDEKGVRALAEEVLMGLGPHAKEGAEGLVEIIADETNDFDARGRAALVLGAIGPEAKGQLEALKKISTDNGSLKEAIAKAVAKIEGK